MKLATLKTIGIALALTGLTSAPLLAEVHVTARQLLAQAETRSQALPVQGEVNKITDRSVIIGEVDAAELGAAPVAPGVTPKGNAGGATVNQPTKDNQDNAVTSPVPAAPVTVPTSTIVVLPAPVAPAGPETRATTAVDGSTATASAPSAPATPAVTAAQPVPMPIPPAAVANTAPSQTAGAQTTSAAAMTKPAGASSCHALNNKVASKRPHRWRSGASFDLSGRDVGTQIERVIRRPEIQSLLAQFGVE